MSPGLIALMLFATLMLGIATVAFLESGRARTRLLLDAAETDQRVSTWLERADQDFRRTRIGRRIAMTLAGSGRASWPVLGFSLAVLAGALVVALLSSFLVGKAASVIIFGALIAVVRHWLVREQGRRVEQFIAQLPELARLLANGAAAGLGMRRSLELAVRELAEPARSEVEQVSGELAVGQSMTMALQHLSERLPSRELAVLVHTLVIQQRAGGGLVGALARIATTLDERKQLRREARTAAAGSLFTGTAVIIVVGIAVVVANIMSPGVIDHMMGNSLGRVALAVSATFFVVGFVLMRRVAKVNV